MGGQASALGVAPILAATFAYGLGGVIAKKGTAGITPLSLATSQLILFSLWLLPLVVFGPQPGNVSAQALAGAAFLGVFGSGLAYLLFYSLLSQVSATQTTAVTYIMPIWGLLWGALAGEHVALTSLLGVAVTLGGLMLMNWKGRA